MHGQLRILEIADEVGHPEVHQVQNRRDFQALHLGQCQVGEFPVVLVGAELNFVVGQAVAQHLQAHFFHQRQVFLVAVVVVALGQQIAAGFALIDGGVAALDARGEHEVVGQARGQAVAVVAGRAAVLVALVVAVAKMAFDCGEKGLHELLLVGKPSCRAQRSIFTAQYN